MCWHYISDHGTGTDEDMLHVGMQGHWTGHKCHGVPLYFTSCDHRPVHVDRLGRPCHTGPWPADSGLPQQHACISSTAANHQQQYNSKPSSACQQLGSSRAAASQAAAGQQQGSSRAAHLLLRQAGHVEGHEAGAITLHQLAVAVAHHAEVAVVVALVLALLTRHGRWHQHAALPGSSGLAGVHVAIPPALARPAAQHSHC
jgi:hypothetical protein